MKEYDHLMQWEINWVMNNPQFYEGPLHQKAVAENLRKNYFLKHANKLMSKFKEFHSTGNRLALEQHFEPL